MYLSTSQKTNTYYIIIIIIVWKFSVQTKCSDIFYIYIYIYNISEFYICIHNFLNTATKCKFKNKNNLTIIVY